MKKIRAVVIGYGDRGATYARYAKSNPEALEISAVADPIQNRRDFAREQFPLSENQVYNSWEKLAEQPKLADFAIIATQDHQHLEPALAMIDKGYHLLLEKPTLFAQRQVPRLHRGLLRQPDPHPVSARASAHRHQGHNH